MVNPMNDDMGGGFFQTRQPPKKADKEPTTTYHEADEHQWNLEAIYGRQEPHQRYREGRPVRAEQEQTDKVSSNAGAETPNQTHHRRR